MIKVIISVLMVIFIVTGCSFVSNNPESSSNIIEDTKENTTKSYTIESAKILRLFSEMKSSEDEKVNTNFLTEHYYMIILNNNERQLINISRSDYERFVDNDVVNINVKNRDIGSEKILLSEIESIELKH